MATTELLVGYVLRPLADATTAWLWQRELCRRLELRGRVVVSPQGLRCTLGGPTAGLEEYARATREHPVLAAAQFHVVSAELRRLADLSVQLRAEAVAFGAAERLTLSEEGQAAVVRLPPGSLAPLLAETDAVLFDARNRDQTATGGLRDALRPDVRSARQLREELDRGRWDGLRDRAVVTYCCCGARAEVLAVLMAARGFSDVRTLSGGLVGAADTLAAPGLWQGSLYLLDGRVRVPVGADRGSDGRCEQCGSPTDHHRECVAPLCDGWALLCNGCADFALCARHRN